MFFTLLLKEFLSNYPLQTGQFAGQLLLLSDKFLLGHRLQFIENECCSKLALPISEFSQTTFLVLWITKTICDYIGALELWSTNSHR